MLMLFIITLGMGCNKHGEISEAQLKKALNITYNELSQIDFDNSAIRYQYPVDFMFVYIYLKDKNYLQDMECFTLDESDVNEVKHIKACLLKNINKKENQSTPHILVKVIPDDKNKDKVGLVFFTNAERTKQGVKYSSILPAGIMVNLKTQKIGNI